MPVLLSSVFLGGLVELYWFYAWPMIIPLYFGLMSLITLIMYGVDKRASIKGCWRTPEKTLHGWTLLGGWPGALIGQTLFRHKTQKQPFKTWLWLCTLLNIIAVVVLYVYHQSLLQAVHSWIRFDS
ncbi:DUF1294 domain-containing protein [Vibrio nitrifigilis]|uniref:DUF1294 domain-containing protein n=1 Tax=Vibrio nitrifigilis TaxID=2789781 RepID=A0ABS0GKK3_9VIBR|nr:DUF1294 domain-containing protein [Vibrio nitrifigilis]MBF9002862.1 DUF1294 domain-containing protein [Vibrio nitrifigilis]